MAKWTEGLHTLTPSRIQPSSLAGFQTHALLKKKKKLFCLKDSAAKKKNFNHCCLFFFSFVLFLAALGLHHILRGFPSCGEQGLLCRSAWASYEAASLVAEPRLCMHRLQELHQLELSRRGTQAELPHDMWDLPEPGMEPTCPTLAGRFLATGSPGRPYIRFNVYNCEHVCMYHGIPWWLGW